MGDVHEEHIGPPFLEDLAQQHGLGLFEVHLGLVDDHQASDGSQGHIAQDAQDAAHARAQNLRFLIHRFALVILPLHDKLVSLAGDAELDEG